MKKSDIFWQTYLSLEKEALEVSKYIFFTDEKIINSGGLEKSERCNSQLETFSPYIADLLVRCCVQIEAISKELYFDIGGTKQRGDTTLLFDKDCLKEIDKKWKIGEKVVLVVSPSFNFTNDANKLLKPLKNAHQKSGTYWERAYQAVKHDRYASLYKGNVKAFIQALAALYLLNLYYRNDSWVAKYNDIAKHDYSMGSSIFSVKAPAAGQLWYDNTPIPSESPYVVAYGEQACRDIESIRQKEQQAFIDYWNKQPELQEPEFLTQLQAASDREKNDPAQRVMPIWELAKYRMNKKFPPTLPFEERKALLINSSEWNSLGRASNTGTQSIELTEDNIQNKIDFIGVRMGNQIMSRHQKLEWIESAVNSEICRVYIPQ